jgi:hypothetical protein
VGKRTDFVDIFGIFEEFQGVAPKNLDELKAFEKSCREHGKVTTAEWIYNFIISMQFHIMAEWDLGNADSTGRKSKGR